MHPVTGIIQNFRRQAMKKLSTFLATAIVFGTMTLGSGSANAFFGPFAQFCPFGGPANWGRQFDHGPRGYPGYGWTRGPVYGSGSYPGYGWHNYPAGRVPFRPYPASPAYAPYR